MNQVGSGGEVINLHGVKIMLGVEFCRIIMLLSNFCLGDLLDVCHLSWFYELLKLGLQQTVILLFTELSRYKQVVYCDFKDARAKEP